MCAALGLVLLVMLACVHATPGGINPHGDAVTYPNAMAAWQQVDEALRRACSVYEHNIPPAVGRGTTDEDCKLAIEAIAPLAPICRQFYIPMGGGIVNLVGPSRRLQDVVESNASKADDEESSSPAFAVLEGRVIPPEIEEWLAPLLDPTTAFFPFLQMMFWFLVFSIVALWFEIVVLRSTLMEGCLSRMLPCLRLKPPSYEIAESDEETAAHQQLPEYSRGQITHFWQQVRAAASTPSPYSNQAMCDVVGFKQHSYGFFQGEEEANITLQRRGSCAGVVEVHVQATELDWESSLKAEEGEHFEDVEGTVRFDVGEQFKDFSVPLIHKTQKDWTCTKLLNVKITRVVLGTAVLGHGYETSYSNDGAVVPGVVARVHIYNTDVFPVGVPNKCRHSHICLLVCYLFSRIRRTKLKFFNTMIGMLYVPIHTVMVYSVVQKLLLNWVTDTKQHVEQAYVFVFCLGVVQFVSTIIYRWGNALAVRNTSRTGATRMYHREQILEQVLTLQVQDQLDVDSSKWFYKALEDANVIAVDCYFFFLLGVQAAWGLFVSFLTLLIFGDVNASFLQAFLVLFFLVPFMFLNVLRRSRLNALAVKARLKADRCWMHVLQWLASVSTDLYVFGSFTKNKFLEEFMTSEEKYKDLNHIVRDRDSDSNMVVWWFGQISYVIMIILGGCSLVYATIHALDDFRAGNLVLLLKATHSFAKYSSQLNLSFVKMLRSVSSLKSVARLLNIRSDQVLREQLNEPHGLAAAPDRIVLKGVQYSPSIRARGCWANGFYTKPASVINIPLHKVVYVHGSDESSRMIFMALVAQVLRPSAGQVVCPTFTWAVLIPPVPVGFGSPLLKLTVVRALERVGAPKMVAARFCYALGLDPLFDVTRLVPGQAQVLTLACALWRDPDVLALIRPLAQVVPEMREQMKHLLRAWQLGGTPKIVQWLSGKPIDSNGKYTPSTRTLIITGEDIGTPESAHVHIDLDKFATEPPLKAKSDYSFSEDEAKSDHSFSEESE